MLKWLVDSKSEVSADVTFSCDISLYVLDLLNPNHAAGLQASYKSKHAAEQHSLSIFSDKLEIRLLINCQIVRNKIGIDVWHKFIIKSEYT